MRVSLKKAVNLIINGQIVAVPTETVYGLAASMDQPAAIDKVFSAKGRPSNNPLIVHVANYSDVLRYTFTPPIGFEDLAKAFWPGPLTLILPVITEKIPQKARAGLPTAGFRVPHHPITLELLAQTGPLVIPSANLSGRPSTTCPEHVEEDFGKDFPVLDGGVCHLGIESTILHYVEDRWQIVRAGSLSAEMFIPVLGYQPLQVGATEKPVCPGQLHRHYSPRAKLQLSDTFDSSCPGPIIGFSDRVYPTGVRVLISGTLSDPTQTAVNLYRLLRQLDQEQIDMAWIDMNFPRTGLWETIAERFQRAAQRA